MRKERLAVLSIVAAALPASLLVFCSSSSNDADVPSASSSSSSTGGLPAGDGAAPVDASGGEDARAGSSGFVAREEPLGGNRGRAKGVDAKAPLSSVVAVSIRPELGADIGAYVAAAADRYAKGADERTFIPPMALDLFRAPPGFVPSVVAKWFDPIDGTGDGDLATGRIGANVDYLAYFGDGWDATAGDPPQWHGSGNKGHMWINHEYISGTAPNIGASPTGQHLLFSRFLAANGALTIADAGPDVAWSPLVVDTHTAESKRHHGGSWVRVVQNPTTLHWSIERAAANVRYDSTSKTLARVSGMALSGPDHDDEGAELPAGVVAGTTSNCSGGQTPWGTVMTAEENTQGQWGDVEPCWTSDNALRAGQGCDPGAAITLALQENTASEFGKHSTPATRHRAENYGFLTEIDPGVAAAEWDGKVTPGRGHKKLGAMGRARWENASFAVGGDWKLLPGKPVVIYAADDRVSGRIFKFVSKNAYTAGMTKAQTRALLDEGQVYVAHFADLDNADGYKLKGGATPTEAARGNGRWIRMALDNTTDVAPNAGALQAGITVGAALASATYNRLGGFSSDDHLRKALFTASNKIGVMELNRPEDVEWNPKSPYGKPQLFVAFTKNERKTALDAAGAVWDPATPPASVTQRKDKVGAIFVVEEADPTSPATSATFTFFEAWHGAVGKGQFDAANPDNIAIDPSGRVFFGTDGNFEVNQTSDALYYLDLDRARSTGKPGVTRPTYGLALRLIGAPSDAELTGPAFSPDMKTIFVSIQHPGEGSKLVSAWPQ